MGQAALALTVPAGNLAGPVHRLDPRVKIVGLLAVTITAVATPIAAWPVWVACLAVLLGVAAAARVPPRELWLRGRIVVPVLAVAALLPLVRDGGLAVMVAVMAKATLGTLSAVLLVATTGVPGLLRGLERLHVPRLFVLIATLMYRYLFVIADEANRMRSALLARGYHPRHALHAGPVGRAAGSLFLRSHARGERVHLAMMARGYSARARVGCPAAATTEPDAPAIRASGLAYDYPGGHPGLCGLDLEVAHGERVAVLGPNGAGKTTLMLHLNGLLRGRGSLQVAGFDVGDCDLRALRSLVGLVFQDPDDQLFMPTVAEDVAFGPLNQGLPASDVKVRVAEALRAVRMSEAGDRAPHQLSMGQRRRVAIATVLAMRPTLLVLDEPSANLDPRARRELLDVLAGIDHTLLVATHDLPFAAELCERAVILAGGRAVADGLCDHVLADKNTLSRHNLELPVGFALDRIKRRSRPSNQEEGMSEAHSHAHPHSHEHSHDGETHAHAHASHDHDHVEHAHEHSHGDVTHSHPHVHEAGLEHDHAHSH